MKKIAIIGSTGSIGTQAVALLKAFPQRYRAEVLVAGKNIKKLAKQIKEIKPRLAVIQDEARLKNLKKLIGKSKTECLAGEKAIEYASALKSNDLILIAFSGLSALKPTLAAVQAKTDIALANKEVLVSAGSLIMPKVKRQKVLLIPVDSEHSAVMQILKPRLKNKILNYDIDNVKRIILTASGGALRNYPVSKLKTATPRMALKHPNWQMGAKITIDSATLMNKGLEVIEAHHLFGIAFAKIEVVIHQQSIIHALVEYNDHSCLAQMSYPDMKLPIQYAFSFPKRLTASIPSIDFCKLKELSFAEPDSKKFPALALAYRAGEKGRTLPAVLNAANERAVELFLKGEIKFTEITELIRRKMNRHKVKKNPTLKDILTADLEGRNF